MELKFKFDLKELSDGGRFTGYASTFGTEDLGGDIVMPGAFAKTIKENPEVPILWSHRDLIGINRAAKEDKRGLWVEGELNLQVQKGQETYALAKQGAVKGLSIGYDAVTVDFTRKNEGIRILKEVKLYEYSFTPFPMNPKARIDSVKTIEDVEVECVRLHNFLTKSSLSLSQREALQRQFIDLLALLSTSTGTKEEAGAAAAAQQNEAPEDLHAALSDLREDLRRLTL